MVEYKYGEIYVLPPPTRTPKKKFSLSESERYFDNFIVKTLVINVNTYLLGNQLEK